MTEEINMGLRAFILDLLFALMIVGQTSSTLRLETMHVKNISATHS